MMVTIQTEYSVNTEASRRRARKPAEPLELPVAESTDRSPAAGREGEAATDPARAVSPRRTESEGWIGRAPQFIKKPATLTTHPEHGHPLRQDLKHERPLELTRAGGGYRAVYHAYEHARVVVVYAIAERP